MPRSTRARSALIGPRPARLARPASHQPQGGLQTRLDEPLPHALHGTRVDIVRFRNPDVRPKRSEFDPFFCPKADDISLLRHPVFPLDRHSTPRRHFGGCTESCHYLNRSIQGTRSRSGSSVSNQQGRARRGPHRDRVYVIGFIIVGRSFSNGPEGAWSPCARRQAQRAKVILWAAAGESNQDIAAQLGVKVHMPLLRRFLQRSIRKRIDERPRCPLSCRKARRS